MSMLRAHLLGCRPMLILMYVFIWFDLHQYEACVIIALIAPSPASEGMKVVNGLPARSAQ